MALKAAPKRLSPPLRGGQKAVHQIKVRLTDDEVQILRSRGLDVAGQIREAAQRLVEDREESRFANRLKDLEQGVQSAARDAKKCSDRLDGLYAQNRAQETVVKGSITEFRAAVAEALEALSAAQMGLERAIQAVDQRQRMAFGLLCALVNGNGTDKALIAARTQFRKLAEDPNSDPAITLYEHIVQRGERASAQLSAAQK